MQRENEVHGAVSGCPAASKWPPLLLLSQLWSCQRREGARGGVKRVLFRAWHVADAQTMLGECHWTLLIFADVSSGEGNPLGGEAWMCAGLFSLVLRLKPGPRAAARMRQRSAHHKEGLSD